MAAEDNMSEQQFIGKKMNYKGSSSKSTSLKENKTRFVFSRGNEHVSMVLNHPTDHITSAYHPTDRSSPSETVDVVSNPKTGNRTLLQQNVLFHMSHTPLSIDHLYSTKGMHKGDRGLAINTVANYANERFKNIPQASPTLSQYSSKLVEHANQMTGQTNSTKIHNQTTDETGEDSARRAKGTIDSYKSVTPVSEKMIQKGSEFGRNLAKSSLFYRRQGNPNLSSQFHQPELPLQ
jgi:hypothetical protein